MKLGWKHYLPVLSETLSAMIRQMKAVLRCPHVLIAWPLHTMLITATFYQSFEKAIWLKPPISFPFPTMQSFQKLLAKNPIDAPQRVFDWIKAQPIDASQMLIVGLVVMLAAAILEVCWLSLLMSRSLALEPKRIAATSFSWIVLRIILAAIVVPLIAIPFVPVYRGLMSGVQGQQAAMLGILALIAGIWGMMIASIWGLIATWISMFFVPLRLLVAGSMRQHLGYLGKLFRTHWRGVIIITVVDWGLRTMTSGLLLAVTAATFFAFGDKPLLVNLTCAAVLLPAWIALRLLGPAALAQLHPTLAAVETLQSPNLNNSQD